MPDAPNVVDFKGVTKRFGSTTVIRDVTFSVPDLEAKGEFIAILGPSGCGKSTVLRLIAGLPPHYPATEGTVLVTLALPDIYNSLRHLFGLAFGYIMLAELINAEHGLGFLLMASQRRGLSEHIILILIIIGLLAYGIDRVLFWFQRGLFPYRAVED